MECVHGRSRPHSEERSLAYDRQAHINIDGLAGLAERSLLRGEACRGNGALTTDGYGVDATCGSRGLAGDAYLKVHGDLGAAGGLSRSCRRRRSRARTRQRGKNESACGARADTAGMKTVCAWRTAPHVSTNEPLAAAATAVMGARGRTHAGRAAGRAHVVLAHGAVVELRHEGTGKAVRGARRRGERGGVEGGRDGTYGD